MMMFIGITLVTAGTLGMAAWYISKKHFERREPVAVVFTATDINGVTHTLRCDKADISEGELISRFISPWLKKLEETTPLSAAVNIQWEYK